ncbi:MAG: hypothetical protein IJH94_07280 [Clostridia bacterium]|nr:hypothetical protein [Clostridia bacterium]
MLHTKNTNLCDELKKGYIEMSVINIEESEAGLAADNEALRTCERNLTECEEDFDCKTR